MSEEIKIDEEFQHKALFDLEFEGKEQRKAEIEHEAAGYANESADYRKGEEERYAKWQANFDLESKPLKNVLFYMEHAPAELKAQATSLLNNLVNKDEYDLKRENRASKKQEIDLDGSKKSLWGKLKNKAKNFWYPNNQKKGLEEAIGALRSDMLKNPEFYASLKRQATKEGQNKISFQDMALAREETAKLYNRNRVDYMRAKEEKIAAAKKFENAAQKSEATIGAIHEVRDKAAKEIELKAMARETTGIKDAQANTGVDRLADKAKMMEGMTPQQRLAFRMSQLRGTSKETPAAPATPRTVDSNVMNKALESKMRA